MELEAVEPADGGLTASGIDPEDAMGMDARVVADAQAGGVDEADAGTRSQWGLQVHRERHEHAREQFDEAGVADQLRELAPQMDLDVLGVERLERAVLGLLKEDGDGHEFTRMHPSCPAPMALGGRCLLLRPPGLKALPKRIDRAKQVE